MLSQNFFFFWKNRMLHMKYLLMMTGRVLFQSQTVSRAIEQCNNETQLDESMYNKNPENFFFFKKIVSNFFWEKTKRSVCFLTRHLCLCCVYTKFSFNHVNLLQFKSNLHSWWWLNSNIINKLYANECGHIRVSWIHLLYRVFETSMSIFLCSGLRE